MASCFPEYAESKAAGWIVARGAVNGQPAREAVKIIPGT
jgi:hypothetical protein